jgi:hypothetical protein
MRHPIQRYAATVWAAQQHYRWPVDVDRVEPVRQQRHSVGGRDHQVVVDAHGVAAAWLNAERSAQ